MPELEEIGVSAALRLKAPPRTAVPGRRHGVQQQEARERNLDVFGLAQYMAFRSRRSTATACRVAPADPRVDHAFIGNIKEAMPRCSSTWLLCSWISDTPLLQFDIVEHVEIIQGPQAAQFGRATFSGAINLITKKGTNEPENRVSVRAAQFGDFETNLLSRGALQEDKLFYMAHARFYTMDGMYRNSLDGRKVGGEVPYNVNGGLGGAPPNTFHGEQRPRFRRTMVILPPLLRVLASNCYPQPRRRPLRWVEGLNDVTMPRTSTICAFSEAVDVNRSVRRCS